MLHGHQYGDVGMKGHTWFGVNRLSVAETQVHLGCDSRQDQEAFEFCEGFAEASTSAGAERDVGKSWIGSGRAVRKPLWVKASGIGKPAWIAVQIPRADEGQGTLRKDSSRWKAILLVRQAAV